MKTITAKDEARFWAKVQRRGPDECWEWQASKFARGYGQFSLGGNPVGAHRVSATIAGMDVSHGKVVCHSCDNRGCINPRHLFIGTSADNSRDMVLKGRSARGEAHSSSKIPDSAVPSIRERLLKGESLRQIAKDYGVSHMTIGRIKAGTSRAHLQ